jgi:uncharacterized protein YndB with AHSA1/START domain
MATNEYRAEVAITAPSASVWKALTDSDQMARWFLPASLGATLKIDDTGTLLVCMGGMEIPVAHLEQDEADRTVSLQGLPDQRLVARLSLVPDDVGSEHSTQVNVVLSGADSMAAEPDEDRAAIALEAWRKGLANLAAAAENKALPYPEGYVAALLGYHRQSQRVVGVERSTWIAAPVERVWSAITDPAQIEGWFSPGTAWTLTDLAPGGRLFVRDPESGGELYLQVIERMEPLRLLVLRTEPDTEGKSEFTDYSLQPKGDGTRLTLTYHGLDKLPEATRHATMEQHAFGFGMVMENVRALLERKPLPYPGGF